MKPIKLLKRICQSDIYATVVILLFFWISQEISVAMDLNKDYRKYRSVSLELWDKESDVRLVIIYGGWPSMEQDNKLSIFGEGDEVRAMFVKLPPKELEQLHLGVCRVIDNFSFRDEKNQKEFDRRRDAGSPYMFEMSLRTSEQGLKIEMSPQDIENFKDARRLFIELIEKFPKEWRDKVRWAKAK